MIEGEGSGAPGAEPSEAPESPAAVAAPPPRFMRPDPKGGYDVELEPAWLSKPLDAEAMFGRVAPLEIEVGFGSGLFLAVEALRRPGANFLAIEKESSQVRRAKEKLRKRGIVNVRLLRSDALYFLEEYVGTASVAAYHIYFSDPWPKKRHHRRRVFQPRLIEILERTLLPGGRVFVKTDVSEYFAVIEELFRAAGGLAVDVVQRLDEQPLEGDVVTNFQQKAISAGHPIHYLAATRRSA